MRELSLFTGAGGGLLGTHLLGWRPVGYVEFNYYCQRIIKQRIEDGIFPEAPIFGDIRAFNSEGYADSYQGLVDVVTAGFPCQPFSTAGKRRGENDDRDMWPATIETIRRVRPRFCLLENVPGLLAHKYFGRILGDLAESGYDARWKVISAAELGAPHKRDRLWIVADRQCERCETGSDVSGRNAESTLANSKLYGLSKADGQRATPEPPVPTGTDSIGEFARRGGLSEWWDTDPADIPDADEFNDNGGGLGASTPCRERSREAEIQRSKQGITEPRLGRAANGVAHRVDRLKAIGNGQVPAVVKAAWELLV